MNLCILLDVDLILLEEKYLCMMNISRGHSLYLNANKTNLILFSPKKNHHEIIYDEKLNFGTHINYCFRNAYTPCLKNKIEFRTDIHIINVLR